MRRVAALAAAFLIGASPASAAADALESALAKELSRAKSELKQEGYPSPYFVSLSAVDVDSWEQRCELGAPYFTGQYRQRLMLPDLRVGDYAMDNHPVNGYNGFQARGTSYQEDETSLRFGLWRQLDNVYKAASADFLRKQALRVSRGKTDYDTDDLAKEPPRQRRAEQPRSAWDVKLLDALTTEGGKALRAKKNLLSADSSARLRRQWTRLRDSEGSAVDFGREVAELDLEASARSIDGTKVLVARRFVAASPSALPTELEIRDSAADMLKDLSDLEVAPTTSPFSAPTLLDPSVAGAVMLSVGLRLSGEEQRNPSGAQTFKGKLGKAVMARGFNLEDDPNRTVFGALRLAGHYEFDDQGVAPKRVTLIEDGVLRGMLLSRYPVVGFSKSNGHGRAFAGYAPEGLPGNLFLTAKKTHSEKELLDRLRAEAKSKGKPYGIWIKKLRGFAQQQGTGGHTSIRFTGGLVYLVDAATGKLTLVRDLDLVGTPLVLLGNILAAGDDYRARNMVYGAPISVIVPSLLLSEGELQRAESRPENPPILPAPDAAASPAAPPLVPTIPAVPHLQVLRYVVRGAGRLYPKFVMQGVADSRQHLEGQDAFLDFKVEGRSLSELGGNVRRLDESIKRLAEGKPIDRSALTGPMTSSAYKATYKSDWP